jgi:hypothetical protein
MYQLGCAVILGVTAVFLPPAQQGLEENAGDVWAVVSEDEAVLDNLGAGVAYGDFDSDGWIDVYVSEMASPDRDVAVADFDNDGDVDLFAANGGLYRNLGNGTFMITDAAQTLLGRQGIETVRVDGGKVEIVDGRITIDGGRVEITVRQP